MDPILGEFIGEMKEFKRVSVERLEKIDTKLENLLSWKIKVGAYAGAIGAICGLVIRMLIGG